MTQKPLLLLLKDYLDLDPFSSDSSSSSSTTSNGFISFPRARKQQRLLQQDSITTVRCLLEAEFAAGPKLTRSRSQNALSKLSVAVLNAVRGFVPAPFPPGRFGRRFWGMKRGRKGGEGRVRIRDIVRLDSSELHGERGSSLRFPTSPVVSSCCSSCSEGEEGSESSVSSSTTSGSSEGFGGGSRDSSPVEKSPSHRRALASEKQANENQDTECEQRRSEEEKQQSSPVSITNFPEEEEDDEVTSPRFEQSLADTERTTHQLLQKIRRFESLADLDLNLQSTHDGDDGDDECDVASSDEMAAWDMIRRLRLRFHVDPRSERLLLDFFAEGSSASVDGVGRLLAAAGDWIHGRGCLEAEEGGVDRPNEVEWSGRWGSFEGGKDDVAADVEVGVLGSLIVELVTDLATG